MCPTDTCYECLRVQDNDIGEPSAKWCSYNNNFRLIYDEMQDYDGMEWNDKPCEHFRRRNEK